MPSGFQFDRPTPKREECFFYHTMELPSGEVIPGHWDLRGVALDYTCRVHLSRARVLDVGSATGFLSFYCERRGADVTSFDIADGEVPDLIPWSDFGDKWSKVCSDVVAGLDKVKNSYWYCHSAFKSRASVYYGNIYDLPGPLGFYDVAIVGSVLLHLSNPFRALESIARHTNLLVITDGTPGWQDCREMRFLPNWVSRQQRDPWQLMAWWQIPACAIDKMLDILGFEVLRTLTFDVTHQIEKYTQTMYSIVAKRKGT